MYQASLASLERIYLFLEEPVEVYDRPGSKDFMLENGTIEFKNVDFSYDKQTPIFTDLSIKLAGGSMTALVGATGAGKSSFAKLISRAYDIDNGEILIDGQELKQLKIKSIRSMMGIVPQEPRLFSTSLFNNITYGSIDTTMEEVINITKLLGLHDFISSLPQGYETDAREGGSRFSQGQKQLVSFARALVKNPDLIVLDEATSSLDPISEISVQRALEKVTAEKTSIIIAHRLSTIRNANKIIVMENGKIVQQGKHEELLLEENGIYKKLYELQFRSEE
jgi:ABC-type multidrug transport system fused ATPase/permease subunit